MSDLQAVIPSADLGNEVLRGDSTTGSSLFDRDGWVVGRQALEPELVREVRIPILRCLQDRGLIQESEQRDRFRWMGSPETLDASELNALAANAPLVDGGQARRAVEALWGRPAALWANSAVFLMLPESAFASSRYRSNLHRDGWHPLGVGSGGDHFNLWVPLTQLGELDGALALVPGSAESDEQPEQIAGFHQASGRVVTATGFRAQQFDGRWRSTTFEVGDALLFRPDLIHGATANRGENVRIGIVIRGQDGRLPLPPAAGLASDRTQPLALAEELVLALLTLRPLRAHDISIACAPRGIVGRFQTLPQETVERAVSLLIGRSLIERSSDPAKSTISVSDAGQLQAREWLYRPIEAIDQLTTVFLLKVALLQERSMALDPLLEAQERQLEILGAATSVVDQTSITALRARALVQACRQIVAELQRSSPSPT